LLISVLTACNVRHNLPYFDKNIINVLATLVFWEWTVCRIRMGTLRNFVLHLFERKYIITSLSSIELLRILLTGYHPSYLHCSKERYDFKYDSHMLLYGTTSVCAETSAHV